jgi:DNA-binding transcriptional MerR regulator
MGIRFMADGDPAGAGDAPAGETTPPAPLGDAGQQAIDRMKTERNTARQEAKAYKDLGLSPDEIRALVAEKNAGTAPDPEKIAREAQKAADAAAKDRYDGKARGSEVRAQAAELNFIKPTQALALLDPKDLADIDVDDDGEVDADAVKKLLEKLATDNPHLLKPTDTTPDYRSAGIGGSGSGTKPEVRPGVDRIRNAYANSPKK